MSDQPLIPDGKKPMNAEKMLEKFIKVRLPLLNNAMKFGSPAPRATENGEVEEEANADAAKGLAKIKKRIVAFVKSLKLKERAKKGIKFIVDSVKNARRNAVDLMASMVKSEKYFFDRITNAIYLVVAIVLSFVGNAQKQVETHVGQATLLEEQATVDETAAENTLLAYWAIGAGCVSSTILVVKNVRVIVGIFFDVIEKIENKIIQAIDILQTDLDQEIKAELDKVVKGKDTMSIMEKQIATTALCELIKVPIDDAEKELPKKIKGMMPCPIRTKLNLFVSIAGPCFVILWWKCYRDLHAVALPNQGRRLFSFADAEGELMMEIKELKPVLITLISNALISFLSSNPVVRFMVNSVIRTIEKAVNLFIITMVKKKVPLDEIQRVLNALTNPQPGLVMCQCVLL